MRTITAEANETTRMKARATSVSLGMVDIASEHRRARGCVGVRADVLSACHDCNHFECAPSSPFLGVAKTRKTRAHARRAARGGLRSGVGVAGRAVGGRAGSAPEHAARHVLSNQGYPKLGLRVELGSNTAGIASARLHHQPTPSPPRHAIIPGSHAQAHTIWLRLIVCP